MRATVTYSIPASVCIVLLAYAIYTYPTPASHAEVNLLRTPDGGIQPQAAMDEKGVLHLIYFQGSPEAGDIFYVRREPGSRRFSAPIRVNSEPDSAIATGSVRGAQIAVGKNERVHVSWLGSRKALPKGPSGASPMLYSRLNDSGSAFEPQRNVMQFAVGLDGGGSVAADRFGHVYVAWHAGAGENGETHRRVWVARSTDEGTTFSREAPAYPEPTGACGCCGMRAFADQNGLVYILYRAAAQSIHRDMYLLVSEDRGRDFSGLDIAPWELNACPMSTASIAESGAGVIASWETAGQVYFAKVDPTTLKAQPAVAAPGDTGKRKHPAVAANSRGETLLVWTEGTGWNQGGSVDWQVFDPMARPTRERGHAEGVPVWGLTTAFARADGGFTIVY